jgi:DNA-binding protein H-NS
MKNLVQKMLQLEEQIIQERQETEKTKEKLNRIKNRSAFLGILSSNLSSNFRVVQNSFITFVQFELKFSELKF